MGNGVLPAVENTTKRKVKTGFSGANMMRIVALTEQLLFGTNLYSLTTMDNYTNVEQSKMLKETNTVKYPDIEVQLVGTDGNAFAILGKVQKALKAEGVLKDELDEFFNEATSSTYDHLLRTCMKWVTTS